MTTFSESEVCCGLFHLPAPPPSPFYVYAIESENGSLYNRPNTESAWSLERTPGWHGLGMDKEAPSPSNRSL